MFGLLAVIIAPTYAQKPEQAQGPHEIVTGEITAQAGSITLWMNFNAHNTNPAKGHVYYINSNYASFEGEVDCYLREGNRVAFGGTVDGGTYPGPRFLVEVEDNELTPDRVRVRANVSIDCRLSGIFGANVTEGDVVIHYVPENAPVPGSQPVQAQTSEQNGNTNTKQQGSNNEAEEKAYNSGAAIDNKWNLSGSFVAHPGYNWGGLAEEGATWNYRLSIKQALDQDNSVGSIHFSSGDVDVVGQVKATKEDYYFGATYQPNIAAVGTTTYNDQNYYFMMIYADNVVWLALSNTDYSTVWESGSVWPTSLRAYQVHSLNPGTTLDYYFKDIH